MNIKQLSFIITIFVLMFPLIPVLASDDDESIYQDKLKEGVASFYLTSLEENQYIQISLEAAEEGKFYLFLFDERPVESFIKQDQTLDDEIYDKAIAYDKDD